MRDLRSVTVACKVATDLYLTMSRDPGHGDRLS